MQRVAFTMRLFPGNEAEYEKRHDEIWPELVAELREGGISDFDIYLADDGVTLFATHLLPADAADSGQPGGPVQQRWWKMMAPLMETNPDNSPKTFPLRRVFHMD
jgi:L-rhamnose mutarotase